MSENTRERLAEAVKARLHLDTLPRASANKADDMRLTYEEADKRVLDAARAHLAAPDDAAEKNAAWEWLVGNRYWPRAIGDKYMTASRYTVRYTVRRDGEVAWEPFAAMVPHVNGKPDPVALASALGRKEGE